MDAATAFALVAATHAGFQLTVTALVYPALAAVDATRWTAAHSAHSRRIAPIVVVIYGVLVLTGIWSATNEPDAIGWAAIALTAAAIAMTAAAAAPLHGRLSTDSDRTTRMRQLLKADQLRCAFAVTGALAAAAALT